MTTMNVEFIIRGEIDQAEVESLLKNRFAGHRWGVVRNSIRIEEIPATDLSFFIEDTEGGERMTQVGVIHKESGRRWEIDLPTDACYQPGGTPDWDWIEREVRSRWGILES